MRPSLSVSRIWLHILSIIAAGSFILPAINDLKAFPIDASDTPPVIAPRHTRSEGQFFFRVLIGSGLIQTAAHLRPASVEGGHPLPLSTWKVDRKARASSRRSKGDNWRSRRPRDWRSRRNYAAQGVQLRTLSAVTLPLELAGSRSNWAAIYIVYDMQYFP